jgi:dehydrogenase/reductase SDR family protein 12
MQLIRNTGFFAYGNAKFLVGGYQNGLKQQPADMDNINLTGKSFLVTGANSGIGYSASHFFAARGGTVHMVCRSEERAIEASKNIINSTSNPSVHIHICDLNEKADIHRLADKFKNENIKLDVLVNNAGIMSDTKKFNSDGIEQTFATNILSNYLLTTLMIPVLQQSPDPRVIFVSSGGGLTQPLSVDPTFSKMNKWDGTTAYAITKRQQIVLCEKFSSVYENTHIKFASMHPGWVDTPAVENSMPDFYKSYKKSLRTPEQGADTICWLATTDSLHKKDNGEFYRDRQPEYKHLPLSGTSHPPKDVDHLWHTCESLCGLKNTSNE